MYWIPVRRLPMCEVIMVTVSFQDDDFISLRRESGHLYLFAQLYHEGVPDEGVPDEGVLVNLILDTGAYLTVLSRSTAIRC